MHEYSTPYCVHNDNVNRVVIHGNVTNIIIISIVPLLYSNPPEMPTREKCITYYPSNRISTGPRTCSVVALPFIYSLL